MEVEFLPKEAKLHFPVNDNWSVPVYNRRLDNSDPPHAPTPIRNVPTENLFLAEFKVNTAQIPALVRAVSSLEVDTHKFLKTARHFYGLAREPA